MYRIIDIVKGSLKLIYNAKWYNKLLTLLLPSKQKKSNFT